MLTKEKIAQAKTPPLLRTLSETGEHAYIRHMSGLERMKLVQTIGADGQMDAVLGVMYFLANEDGTRMYGDKERADVESMDGLVFQDVFLAGLEVNGLMEGSEDEAAKK